MFQGQGRYQRRWVLSLSARGGRGKRARWQVRLKSSKSDSVRSPVRSFLKENVGGTNGELRFPPFSPCSGRAGTHGNERVQTGTNGRGDVGSRAGETKNSANRGVAGARTISHGAKLATEFTARFFARDLQGSSERTMELGAPTVDDVVRVISLWKRPSAAATLVQGRSSDV